MRARAWAATVRASACVATVRARSVILAALQLLVFQALSSSRAAADPLSVFGFGPRAEALGGAVTADASGWAAAFYNPAGVARADEVQAAVGWGYGITRLRLDGQDAGVTAPHGLSAGLSVPIPLGPVRLAFGLALYLPDQFVARVRIVPPAEPHFVLLDNNLDRIVVSPVLALRPVKWLSIGGGATLLADAAGNGIDFDVGVVGGQKIGRAALDASLPIRAAPVAGISVEPTKWLRIGAAYRGAIDLRVKLDILAHVNIAGAVTGDTRISLRAVNDFTPQRVALGASVDILPSLTAMAEVSWNNWSAFHGGAADLEILVALGVTPSLLAATLPVDGFHDTFVPRAGVEYRRRVAAHVGLSGRLGFVFEPSPVPVQVGLTSYADNERVQVCAGAGVELSELPAVLEKPLRFDVGASWLELVDRTTIKDPRVFPGRGFSSGGRIVHLSAMVEARF